MSYDQPPQAPTKSGDDKLMMIITHLLGIISGFIGALIIYFVATSDTVKAHAREALNFQLTLLIGYVIGFVLTFVLVGIFVLLALPVVNIVFCVIAAIKANDGVLWSYPATIRFIKQFADNSSNVRNRIKDTPRIRVSGARQGTSYFRARYYDPQTCEFIRPNPLEYVDGMSLYRAYFVPNNLDFYGTLLSGPPIVVIVAGVISACLLPHFHVAMALFPNHEILRHCWASCTATRTCSKGVSFAAGVGFEVLT